MNGNEPTQPTPVAIIGIGCMFPKAADRAGYWSNIQNRVDAITDVPPTHWRPEDYFDNDPKAPDRTYAARGGFLSPVEFPPLEFGISPNSLEATDSTQLLGLMAAREALEDAGYGANLAGAPVGARSPDRAREQAVAWSGDRATTGGDRATTGGNHATTGGDHATTGGGHATTGDATTGPQGRSFDRNRVSVILGVTGTLELVIPLGARLGHPRWRRALKEAGVLDTVAEEVVRRISE